MKTIDETMLLRKALSKTMIFFGFIFLIFGSVSQIFPPHSLRSIYFGLTLLLGGLFFYIGESIDYKNLVKEPGEQ